MVESPIYITLLGFLIFTSYTIQAITGFGSIVIALTIGAVFIPIQDLLPVLVALNIPLCVYIVIRNSKDINTQVLFKRIIPLMAIGTGVGYVTYSILKTGGLLFVFGVTVAVLSVREIYFSFHEKEKKLSVIYRNLFLFLAGITHGLFASGGPLLVFALFYEKLSRQAYRATLMSVWLILNSILFLLYIFKGEFTVLHLKASAFYVILIPAGIWIGEKFHDKIPEKQFKLVIFIILLFSGMTLIYKSFF